MDVFQAIILGIVQGITEWLPVSSSGHLVLAQRLFGLSQPLIFDVMLHIGSLLVVFIFFWKDIKELILGIIRFEKEKLRMLLFIILATIPIALVGYFLKDTIHEAFSSLIVVGFGLIFTSILLFFSKYPKRKDKKLNWHNSLIVGFFQAIAILPGVSRSGSTISSGMFLGIKKEEIAKFSFIIFIPAILGATIIELPSIGAIENLTAMIIGTVVSAVVGYFSLKLLMSVIKKDKFYYFAIYCLTLGLIVLGFSLIKGI
ncbi:MAG: undecaprenyl-diphosphate phosphatase [Candidatus Nanoarchaeia archaeon]